LAVQQAAAVQTRVRVMTQLLTFGVTGSCVPWWGVWWSGVWCVAAALTSSRS